MLFMHRKKECATRRPPGLKAAGDHLDRQGVDAAPCGEMSNHPDMTGLIILAPFSGRLSFPSWMRYLLY